MEEEVPMERFLLALVAGLAGGVGGALAVDLASSPRAETLSASDSRTLREIRDRLDRLEPRTAAPPPVVGSAAPSSSLAVSSRAAEAAGERPEGAPGAARAGDLEAIAARAAELALEKQVARASEKAAQKKKRLPLADVARELDLAASQEDELRRIYADTTERYLKVMAEPESDAESLRRELEAAKGDAGKKMGITMRLLPKLLSKFPDLMAIEGEKSTRIAKALGPEKAARFGDYQVAEEDPFDIGGSFSLGATAGD
jgi:hypothetical protein